MTEEQFDRLKAELEQGYTGSAAPAGRCSSKAGSTGRRWA